MLGIRSAIMIGAIAAVGFGSSGASAYTASKANPVVFVHGYEAFNCPSSDGAATWNATINYLRANGWTGTMNTVAYYSCDVNNSLSLDGYGSHTAYYGTSSGHETGSTGHLSHNRYADIRHLAYHLAWTIYNRFSSHGQAIELITHSMGGLIARSMLYRVAAHDASFPPYLYVQDAMAIAPPNNGAPFAAYCWTTQCNQMTSGSSYLAELNGSSSGMNPQGTNGTDWTVMTSYCDSTVPDTSALNFGNVHKVEFYTPCYGHSDYMQDAVTTSDADVDYADPPGGTWYSWASAPHAVAWSAHAIDSSTW